VELPVVPLLFRWKDLDASALRTLMRVPVGDEPLLYLNVVLDMLRKMQKKNEFPTFSSFRRYISNYQLMEMQRKALDQRLNLVESLLADSEENAALPDRVAVSDHR
jgi:hypothetical protein